MNTTRPSPSLDARDLIAWRRWLKAHHSTERLIWLVFHKSTSQAKGITFDDALDEALCWGWIDSLVKRIDDKTYARKFTQRTNTAKWSISNINRLRRLFAEERIQPAGRAVISDSSMRQVLDGATAAKRPHRATLPVPAELEHALQTSPQAKGFFESLAPSYRRNYLGWVSAAKQAETRKRRAEEAVRLLLAGTKVLLK